MKAMILAAGRGERMRPLTDHTPKPLLSAGGKPLIVWHLERLAACGFKEIVINHAHLGEQIESALGNGQAFGLAIAYSPEPPGALETAGGIAQALPLLGADPFLVVNGDIWCDWDFKRAQQIALKPAHAHLLLVDNPAHHASGDFCLAGESVEYAQESLNSAATAAATVALTPALTYAGIGVFSPAFFAAVNKGSVLKLRPLLDAAIAQKRLSGEYHAGAWSDIGTPERLIELDQQHQQ